MMLLGHRTVAAPCALTLGGIAGATGAPFPVALIIGAVVVHSSGWNDLDHRSATASNEFGFISRALSTVVRGVSWGIYKWTKTSDDVTRQDSHRGFTHTIEGCCLFSATVWVILSFIPFTSAFAGWMALGVLVGTLSHLLGDMMTPSGVPLQISFTIDGQRWQRYAFGWKWVDVPILPLVALPWLTLVTVGGRNRKGPRSIGHNHTRRIRPGLFKTDSAAEHYIAIPIIWLLTGVGCLIVTGTLWPLLYHVIGL